MNVCVLNAGSSSLKYQVLRVEDAAVLTEGLIERIGAAGSEVRDHASALASVLHALGGIPIDAVGHRVVHGGALFSAATLVTDEVEAAIEGLVALAPLHNPAGLAGIRAARASLPGVPNVVVFDTAYHQTLPAAASTYALDTAVAAEHGIRRYGFHGSSYAFVAPAAAALLGRSLDGLRLVVLHLGNGASAAAIGGGVSIDTSMGLTPLQGLVMGTRSGDLDPAVLLHLTRVAGYDAAQLDDLLNKRSGLLGLAGAGDLRDVIAAAEGGEASAQLALDVYVHRIRHYVGAYAAQLGGLDALVFTAGVGENSALIRERVVERLGFLGLVLDPEANAARERGARDIAAPDATARILVVPTNEELEIARQTAQVVAASAE